MRTIRYSVFYRENHPSGMVNRASFFKHLRKLHRRLFTSHDSGVPPPFPTHEKTNHHRHLRLPVLAHPPAVGADVVPVPRAAGRDAGVRPRILRDVETRGHGGEPKVFDGGGCGVDDDVL